MAPEVIEETEYNTGADIWSFGILAMELANGETPEKDVEDPKDLLAKYKKNGAPKLNNPKWSKDFHEFVGKCLVMD